MLRALRALLARAGWRARVVDDQAVTLHLDGRHPEVSTARGGRRYAGERLILAAGAWVTQLGGLPRTLPVEPVRGQMLSLRGVPLRHVIYGPRGYVVPRVDSGVSLVGSTMEYVGFEVGTTPDALARLADAGREVCPALGSLPVEARWSGLRPVTPDLQPIIGADPDYPALLYACGHSRNGVLLAPLTGDCIAALVVGADPPADLSPFEVTRFRQ
jgi:glycine oxidase